MSIKTIAISATTGALCAALISFFLLDGYKAELSEKLRHSPPVVVVDFTEIAMNYPEGATVEELEKLMMQTNEAVVKLQSAGYLVLDSSAVLAAPLELYLPEDVIQ